MQQPELLALQVLEPAQRVKQPGRLWRQLHRNCVDGVVAPLQVAADRPGRHLRQGARMCVGLEPGTG